VLANLWQLCKDLAIDFVPHHWLEIPLGLAVTIVSFWVIYRLQGQHHWLRAVSLATFASSVLLYLPLARLTGIVSPAAYLWLLVVCVLSGVLSLAIEPWTVSRWSLAVAVLAALGLFYWLFAFPWILWLCFESDR